MRINIKNKIISDSFICLIEFVSKNPFVRSLNGNDEAKTSEEQRKWQRERKAPLYIAMHPLLEIDIFSFSTVHQNYWIRSP